MPPLPMAVPPLVPRNAAAPTNNTPRGYEPQNDRIARRTSVAIGVALICFVTLVLGLYVVARWRPTKRRGPPMPPPPNARPERPRRRTGFIGWVRAAPFSTREFTREQQRQLSSSSPESSEPSSGAATINEEYKTFTLPSSKGARVHGGAHRATVEMAEVDAVSVGREPLQ
ncbi:hypothetical protein SERLA73DRAFT_169040 [Serpula lacrymans var. lacrymans S7.3]|uniref:Transmembrane protein n=2 Tax=Serpula lacrymans var. lacrymans TaxID=341189 RepID=F8Q0U2_SERL3|nr:uncharacterized protein SERLADRAFT_469515 [Serpula lacrymans var. lacrymans S7.9]EGN97921.1 hypothetical protein SERLA73DRAFT_169040 [Serpula lacrymans var. lacrymans S7.3]EGO23507.1 hypothetical protein SERLADRAFT_469515 [Serpula lacrymans var. lacrymans S7.9]